MWRTGQVFLDTNYTNQHEFVKVRAIRVNSGLGLRLSRFQQFANFSDLTHCINVKPKSVRLFIKPYCGWCHKAMRWLDQHGVDYKTINVMDDEAAYDEMIRLSGQDLAPVIDVDGEILADFGPEQLVDFFKRRNNARVQVH